jgi:hypothetical protein
MSRFNLLGYVYVRYRRSKGAARRRIWMGKWVSDENGAGGYLFFGGLL